jgi:hypothetical protein
MGEIRNAYKILVGNPEGKKKAIGRPGRHGSKDTETDLKGGDLIRLPQGRFCSEN